tara:strand:+ start:211 stop:501 length:291 start_codon:yes stop_codon:yes gene_type:complete
MNLHPNDTRVEMPTVFKHLLISTIGIAGLFAIFKGDSPPDYTDSIIIFLLAIFSGCATFGLASILSIIKQGGGISDVWNAFVNNIDIVFKDDRKNK